MSTRDDILITAFGLAQLIAAGDVTLLDVRWQLAKPDGRDDYLAGRLVRAKPAPAASPRHGELAQPNKH